ncbi:extracellular catalytic domain type 1 short-chain-length polyhydroxyalkanoate depolymerase [Roseicitreum antarcticum]|uniref:Esterase, PHB depolymerase family n=1 Tax=Roseicitreum antarcticum TaxID=564137 RepID=A0A1H2YV43_9RHOB|nr:PHB depolymerase family esterase [Roseicitreum antarcticum]SDX08449.1 esterase, PHB depolymerase family [Roseicitreum antarcticum]
MSRIIAAGIRRTTRLLGPRAQAKSVRRVQKAMVSAMISAAFAPLTAPKPKPLKARNVVQRATPSVAKRRTPKDLPVDTAPRPVPMPDNPKTAQYLSRRHSCSAGTRSFKLYLPATRGDQPTGLIVMLHGCNQTPDDFAAGTHMNALAEKYSLAIAYPAQALRDNPAGCWNWFKPGDQARGAGEPAILASLTRKLMREFGLTRDAVFVAGLSAGGAMAAILADVYGDVFSAAGVHSGLARGSASNVVSAMSAMRSGGRSLRHVPAATGPRHAVRRIVFHGDSDSTVHPSNAAQIVEAAVGKAVVPVRMDNRSLRERGYARHDFAAADGNGALELWMIDGGGHAWSGGRAVGSYTERSGPDASAQMVRFFLQEVC